MNLTRERWARLSVIAMVAAALLAKAWLAWRTLGQDDTYIVWPKFMQDVHQAGPLKVYGLPTEVQPYNHPPLIGWWLLAIDTVHSHIGRIPLGFLLRIGSVILDFLCGILIFEVLRRRQALWQATAAGILVGASPVFYVISGYHGNHDSDTMFLAILSAYLLVDRRWPALAGIALALAISVKMPSVVAVPAVLAAAWAIGRRTFVHLAAGFGAVVAVLWLPPLVAAPREFPAHVLLYSADSFPRQWGIVQFLHSAHLPSALADLYVMPGRLLVAALCAVTGAWIALRRPDRLVAAMGLVMATFLLLSAGWAPQYMAWPVAAIYALSFWPATVYNIATGVFLIALYTDWSGGIPWNSTLTVPLTSAQVIEAGGLWLILAGVVAFGARHLYREATLPRWPDRPHLPHQAGIG